MTQIEVIQADITQLAVDAIVNAANTALLGGGGGVDGAIHRAAGPELLAECRALNGCATGQAKITRGYQLPARYVIHAVGPIWRGGKEGEAELLASCYRKSLQLAFDHQLNSIAFSAISCGVYGYPLEQAATIAVNSVCDTLKSREHQLEQVIFCCFNEEVAGHYRQALGRHAL